MDELDPPGGMAEDEPVHHPAPLLGTREVGHLRGERLPLGPARHVGEESDEGRRGERDRLDLLDGRPAARQGREAVAAPRGPGDGGR